MDQHIAVLGLLLTAIVFSVGFLSARMHASFDTVEVEVNGQTWRIRDALLRGERMTSANLKNSLTVVRRTRDPVATLTRVINLFLFAATVALSIDAFRLLRAGVEAPRHAGLLVSLVFAGSAAVTAIGELDVRKIARDQRTLISSSLPGRFAQLSRAVEAADFRLVDGLVAELRDTFPRWGMLTEIHAYSLLRQGRADAAYEAIRQLVADSDDLYQSHIVGVAAAMTVRDGVGGLSLLAAIDQRRPNLPGSEELRRALSLYLGHLDTMLAAPSVHVSLPERGGRLLRLRRRPARSPLSLDIATVPETRALLDLMLAWDSGDDLRAFTATAAGAPLLRPARAVLGLETDAAAVPAEPTGDPLALETSGIIELASGQPRQALRTLERAVRIAPAMSRLHWAVAIASARVGWSSAALAALKRADTLEPGSPVVRVASAVLRGTRPSVPEVAAVSRARADALGPLQLALLGLPAPRASEPPSIRSRFSAALLELAGRAAQAAGQETAGVEAAVS